MPYPRLIKAGTVLAIGMKGILSVMPVH